jgi:hypothetical protein
MFGVALAVILPVIEIISPEFLSTGALKCPFLLSTETRLWKEA